MCNLNLLTAEYAIHLARRITRNALNTVALIHTTCEDILNDVDQILNCSSIIFS